jgi:2-amino-4-hydroxy-6-hydroxymethyldihydropteridine diphosphokinase
VARAIVSLGSNIEPRAEYLARAVESLAGLPLTRLARESSIEETEPVDVPPEFSDLKFLNQVAVFETGLEAHDFSRRMHSIEDALGRVRTVRNGPRTIDIDLIDFDGMVLDEPELVLPHPRAAERDFVMRPLAELGVEWRRKI